jgi:hypothetical protein
MGIEPLGHFIQLPNIARQALKLQSGDIVFLHVIKEVANGKWAIGLKGTVLSARTSLALRAGDVCTALVVKDGTKIVLKLISNAPSHLEAALIKDGLPHDALSLLIVSDLIKSNVKIDDVIIRAVKLALEKLKGDAKRNARIVSLLLAKGIDIDSGDLGSIVYAIDYGAQPEGERQKQDTEKQKQPFPKREEVVESLKKAVRAAQSDNPHPLAVFNHLAAASPEENWIVCPYMIDEGPLRLSGTLRFLFDVNAWKIRKIVIVACNEEGEHFTFLLRPEGALYKMSVYCDDKPLIGASLKRWGEIIPKLSNLGVKCDDILVDDAQFDGFDEAQSGITYRSIDTEG